MRLYSILSLCEPDLLMIKSDCVCNGNTIELIIRNREIILRLNAVIQYFMAYKGLSPELTIVQC